MSQQEEQFTASCHAEATKQAGDILVLPGHWPYACSRAPGAIPFLKYDASYK